MIIKMNILKRMLNDLSQLFKKKLFDRKRKIDYSQIIFKKYVFEKNGAAIKK